MSDVILRLDGVSKQYGTGPTAITALSGVDLTVGRGGRMLRRSISAWQALLVAGIGAVVGTAAGQIPVWGFAQTGPGFDPSDTPWPWLVALGVLLPVASAAVSWLVPPPHPHVARRTAIA